MWIKISKTYAGPAGTFNKDMKYDLPEAVIKQLPKGSFKKCSAPWDANLDKAAAKQAELTSQMEALSVQQDALLEQIEETRKCIDYCDSQLKEMQPQLGKLADQAEQAAKKAQAKNATNKQKAVAGNLARQVHRQELFIRATQTSRESWQAREDLLLTDNNNVEAEIAKLWQKLQPQQAKQNAEGQADAAGENAEPVSQ